MFENSGVKLKAPAKAVFILLSATEVILSVIITATTESISVAVSALYTLPLLNYIISLIIYGFGTVVDNAADIAEHFCDNEQERKNDTNPESEIDSDGLINTINK